MKRVLLILAAAAVAITACKKADDTKNQNPPCDQNADDEAAGKEAVEYLKGLIMDQDGNLLYDPTATNGLYYVGVDSKDDAKSLAVLFAPCGGFKGEDFTGTLPAGKGTVKITNGDKFLFYSVALDVESLPKFTLDIMDNNYKEEIPPQDEPLDGISGTYHQCQICHKTWKSNKKTCPWQSTHP